MIDAAVTLRVTKKNCGGRAGKAVTATPKTGWFRFLHTFQTLENRERQLAIVTTPDGRTVQVPREPCGPRHVIHACRITQIVTYI